MTRMLAVGSLERRVLILAPIGKDAKLIDGLLRNEGVSTRVCESIDDLVDQLGQGAGAVLITEEALADTNGDLGERVRVQPPWSDLPILVLTQPGADSAAVDHVIATLGNVTLLERPVRSAALSTAVRSALRARTRQYETRAHIEERELADRRKDQFLATLAHELRNPLAPIRNSVQLLKMTGFAPQVQGMMERQVDQMVRLIDDLMEMSRISRGKVELRRERIDLATIIGTAIETSRPLIEDAGHHFTTSLPNERIVVDADPLRLAQVFSNLLNNSAKYTDPGGRITLTVMRSGDGVFITVEDNGIGIPQEKLPKVFDIFMQAESGFRAQGGLGIGLTLVRGFVELHGGRVRAESDGPGLGSRFIVQMPVAFGPTTPVSAPATIPLELNSAMRILVVDDNHDAADSLGELLKHLGGAVRVVHDGATAIDAFTEFHPSIVFLDLGMPGMDGYEVARRIRRIPYSSKATLVALTGWGQPRDRRLTSEVGFDHHLVKPADLGALRAVLEAVPA